MQFRLKSPDRLSCCLFVLNVSLFFFAVWSHIWKRILELERWRICILSVPSPDKLGTSLWRVVSSENDASGNEWKWSSFSLEYGKHFVWLRFCLLSAWFKQLAPLFIQSEVIINQSWVARTHFFALWCRLHVFAMRFDWLSVLSVYMKSVIGQSDFYGFVFWYSIESYP